MGNIRELLYPSLRRELRTALSAIQAEHALACEVENPRWLELFGYERKTFEGTLGGGSFDIQRSIAYRNSVLPRIRGRIRAEPVGASMFIEVSLSPVLLALVGLFMGGSALPLFAGSVDFSGRLGLFFGMGVLWALVIVGFHFEAAKAQRALVRILDATVIPPDSSSR